MTVHAIGGMEMVQAAVEGGGEQLGVLAVTVLTSFDDASLATAIGKPEVVVGDEVARLADLAHRARAHGVVCSGAEAGGLYARYGDELALLVPGIRMAGGAAHDQRRVVTPAQAASAGARYIVLGRAVTAADDPNAAMARVLSELETVTV